MSGFGLLAMLLFVVLLGGLVALEYTNNSDLALARGLLLVLYILIFCEFLLAIYEYPAYIATGIVFISMGYKLLADVIFIVVGAFFAFLIIMLLAKINWKKFIVPNKAKIIAAGVLLVALIGYTELYNGAYSFDSLKEFRAVKQIYSQYDNHFFPTKYIKHYSKSDGKEHIAMMPFDVTSAAGKQPLLYKAETYYEVYENGQVEVFFYPFSWKLYEGGTPVSFGDSAYVTAEADYEDLHLPVSSHTDVSQTDADSVAQ